MNCNTTPIFPSDCSFSLSGINRAYIAEWSDMTGQYEVNPAGFITKFRVGLLFQELPVKPDSVYTEAFEITKHNYLYEQSYMFTLDKLKEGNYRNAKALQEGRFIVVFQDNSGNLRIAGLDNGLTVVSSTGSTGKTGDFTGFELDLTGKDRIGSIPIDVTYFNGFIAKSLCDFTSTINDLADIFLFKIRDCKIFE